MKVHLIDGTYELFRHYFALPSKTNDSGQEVGAAAGVLGSMLGMIEAGATHLAVATDQVIHSFRQALWSGYKDGSGIEPDLHSQFPLLEEGLRALGVVVWPMVEHEADDGLGAGAAMAAADPRVEQVLICTPDKDLCQCVVGDRVVQFDRRKREIRTAKGVIEKFGVPPASMPDYQALVGDSSDGYPGLNGWGAKSAAAVLARYAHLERIPESAADWGVPVRGAAKLAATLAQERELAFLFRRLATIDLGAPVSADVDALEWTGPAPQFPAFCELIKKPRLVERVQRFMAKQPTRRWARPPGS